MNGQILKLSREEYDALKADNFSRIKNVEDSEEHFQQSELMQEQDKDEFRRGRLTHMALFEHQRFASEVKIWKEGDKRGNAWKEFKAEWDGFEIIKPDERDLYVGIANAVRSHPVASKYVTNGKSEMTLLWERMVPKMKCKGMVDFIANVDALADLKVVANITPRVFGLNAARYFWHVQAAFYRDGFETITGKRPPYKLIAVQAKAPHVVAVYNVPEFQLDAGREKYMGWLERIEAARRENNFPGPTGTGEGELQLPQWAVPSDNDLSELDLQFNEETTEEAA